MIRSNADLIKRFSPAGSTGGLEEPRAKQMPATWGRIHDTRRLLEARKRNHNPLDWCPRWLSNQPGSEGELSADGPLRRPWTPPQATCSVQRWDSSLSTLWSWLQPGRVYVCSHRVVFFFAVFVVICIRVYTGRSWTQQDSVLFSVPCGVSRYEGIHIWKAEAALCPQLLWPEV